MELVVFDLEWNGAYSERLGSNINEIIEFGAVRLNEKLEVTETFQTLVRPVICKRINSPVRTLTSLTYRELKSGVPFSYAFSRFNPSESTIHTGWERLPSIARRSCVFKKFIQKEDIKNA